MHAATEKGILYFAGTKFCYFFLKKFLSVIHFAKFLREVAKATKCLKTKETKIFNVFFRTKKSYCNIKTMEISPVFRILLWLI